MEIGFLLIIVSAIFHASWNFFVKYSKEKVSFNIYIQIVCAIAIILYTAIFHPYSFFYDKNTVLFALASAFFFSLYQHFTALSYKYGDVSMVYPITTSSPFFIIIWAHFLLGEKIGLMGLAGIILILIGCYIMNITKGSGKKGSYGIILAIIAAFVYSFGAMADKMGVGTVNTPLYILLFPTFMVIYSLSFSFISHRKGGKLHTHVKKFPKEWKLILLGGIAMAASTVTYRYGLIDIEVSYASALRQISSLFGVLLGIFFLKESYGIQRIIGSIVIITGVALIRFGM